MRCSEGGLVRAFIRAFVLSVFSVFVAAANTSVLFQGTLGSDDQIALFQFTLAAAGPVTIQSYGYGGGTAGATTIPAGGFAALAVLFAPLGGDYVQAKIDNGGHCPPAQLDPVTGNCSDPFIQTTLDAGTYYLGLSVNDNVPLTGILADGYTQTGNPGFTCAEGGLSGQFCDVTDALFRTRTGDWAVQFTGADTVTNVNVPEPSTIFIVVSGGLLGALLARRRFC